MLVQMKGNRGVQFAYTKQSWAALGCGVCKCYIIPRMLYTLQMAPNYGKVNPETNRYEMISYAACEFCAPFEKLEQYTGEMNLRAWMEAERAEMEKPLDEQRTELQLPSVHVERRNTPRRLRSVVQPTARVLKKLVLQGSEASWIR